MSRTSHHQPAKSNVNVSRFLTTITAVGAYLYFMDPIINKDTLLPVHFPRTSFKAVTLFIIPRVRLGVGPKPEPDILTEIPVYKIGPPVSVHTAAVERR